MDVLRWAWDSLSAVCSWFWNTLGSLLSRWWSSPEASAALTIAVIAGIFAVYQLRLIPAERRGRILTSMIERYTQMKDLRSLVMGGFPPLLDRGYVAVARAVDNEIAALEPLRAVDTAGAAVRQRLAHLYHLRDEAEVWRRPELGVSFTDARELLRWEFKLRAMLWCVETLRAAERTPGHPWRPVIESAKDLVNQLNDFVLDYENGVYPPRELFGQLHRSLAPTAKTLEPLVWARSPDGRWGRRVLRIGLAAQHYNDVTRIHRNTPLVLDATDGDHKVRVVVHPARTVEYFGVEGPDRRLPAPHRTRFMWRLNAQSLYWSLVGKLRLQPRRFVAYGGRRLRRHMKAEEAVAGCIRYLVENYTAPSTDFVWALPEVRAELMRRAKAVRRAGGTSASDGVPAVPPASAGDPVVAPVAAADRPVSATAQPPNRTASAQQRERTPATKRAGAKPPPARRGERARQSAAKTPAARTPPHEPPAQTGAAEKRPPTRRTAVQPPPERRTAAKKAPVTPPPAKEPPTKKAR